LINIQDRKYQKLKGQVKRFNSKKQENRSFNDS